MYIFMLIYSLIMLSSFISARKNRKKATSKEHWDNIIEKIEKGSEEVDVKSALFGLGVIGAVLSFIFIVPYFILTAFAFKHIAVVLYSSFALTLYIKSVVELKSRVKEILETRVAKTNALSRITSTTHIFFVLVIIVMCILKIFG